MIETIAFIITGLGLTASIIYYAKVLENSNKTRELQLKSQEQALETRQAQLFMPLYETYRNKEFREQITEIWQQSWTDPNDFADKYGPDANPEAFATRVAVCSYFEGIGVLVKRDLVARAPQTLLFEYLPQTVNRYIPS